jgi:A/G-specific adenine glycosylase
VSEAFAALLLAWHRPDDRPLAFRDTTEPWAVLVSEVMLQQTQAPRVERHWRTFMDRFRTPGSFAAASPADAVRAWQGLGYNRRAIRLREAAVAIVERHEGRVPASLPALEALPGIGPYTARAVAAICFAIPVAALDTNIRRVVGRVVHGHGQVGDPGVPMPPRALQAAADALLGPAEPRAWTLAAMDLGATVCRPRLPNCPACPLQAVCRYRTATAGEEVADARPAGAPGASLAGTVPARPRPVRGASTRPFPTTTRWLRGRLVDALRYAVPGSWMEIDGPLGTHSAAAVAAALASLERDGLLERDGERRVRLPTGMPPVAPVDASLAWSGDGPRTDTQDDPG